MNRKHDIKEWLQIPQEARPGVRYWLPGAAVCEKDLKEEIRQLSERGFGRIEITALTKMKDILTGEDGWGTENWDKMVQVIGEVTNELGMVFDITNGPKWPLSMPGIKNPDDPAAARELTYGVTEFSAGGIYKDKVPARRVVRDQGKEKLVHVLAYIQSGDHVLRQESYRSLDSFVTGDDANAELECSLPLIETGEKWLVFAFYEQPTAEVLESGETYIIDHIGPVGVEACEKYWTPFMERCGELPSMESVFCDSMEYRASIEWTAGFEKEFESRRGYSLKPYLPFIGCKEGYPDPDVPGYQLENKAVSDMINRDYLETLTQCYCEYHLAGLERMAQKYGKTLRYQVAYNKPFEIERSALYVNIPENEALGGPAIDRQKWMASAAHLGRKKRYSFECAAEYVNGYGQEYEDLFWWIKRSLMAGMNAQVLHGASYSGAYYGKYSENGKIPGVTWPGYEGFRKAISNYWNRTLSVSDARDCLDTIARMNAIFMKKAKVDCAVYKADYLNDGLGSEHYIYQDEGTLSAHGYSYEMVSPALLELPVCKVEERILDKDGVGYKCLIIPEQSAISVAFLKRVEKLLNAQFPVLWMGKKPENAFFFSEWDNTEKQLEWKAWMKRIWEREELIHFDSLTEVPELLRRHGILPEIELDGNQDVITAVRKDEEENRTYYALYVYNRVDYTPENPNPETLAAAMLYRKETIKPFYKRSAIKMEISVRLHGEGQVYQCDPWNGKMIPLPFRSEEGWSCGTVTLEEDEMLILALLPEEACADTLYGMKEEEHLEICFEHLELEEFVPDSEDETSFLRSHFRKCRNLTLKEGLQSWMELDPELEYFAGRGTYYGSFEVKARKETDRYILKLGAVSDTFHVYVNGKRTDVPNQILKETDITEWVREGQNELKIVVVSTLYNRINGPLRNTPDAFFKRPLYYAPRKYGIWDTDEQKTEILVKK